MSNNTIIDLETGVVRDFFANVDDLVHMHLNAIAELNVQLIPVLAVMKQTNLPAYKYVELERQRAEIGQKIRNEREALSAVLTDVLDTYNAERIG